MQEAKLSHDDDKLRAECERTAKGRWPGARVLVEELAGDEGQEGDFCAAVCLPEDGVDLDVSAERAAGRSAHEALRALLETLRREGRS